MSRLDLTLQEEVLLQTNELYKELTKSNASFLNEEEIDSFGQKDIDLKEWLEIFEEDQVKLQGCR